MIYFLLLIPVLAAAFAIWTMITLIKNPDSSRLNWIFSWHYRTLRRIRRSYIYGLKCDPPTGYEFFYSRVQDFLNNEPNIKKPLADRQDILNMLQYEEYVHHYFVECGDFTYPVYRSMWNDYRTGAYSITVYSSIERLRRVLPQEISTSEKAFKDFMKFVDAGWFDPITGMFILDGALRNHQHIGRAIRRICQRSGIGCPDKVFSSLWGIEAKKIKEWLRENENKDITEGIDKIVKDILKERDNEI